MTRHADPAKGERFGTRVATGKVTLYRYTTEQPFRFAEVVCDCGETSDVSIYRLRKPGVSKTCPQCSRGYVAPGLLLCPWCHRTGAEIRFDQHKECSSCGRRAFRNRRHTCGCPFSQGVAGHKGHSYCRSCDVCECESGEAS